LEWGGEMVFHISTYRIAMELVGGKMDLGASVYTCFISFRGLDMLASMLGKLGYANYG
jgi:hypothetical protein